MIKLKFPFKISPKRVVVAIFKLKLIPLHRKPRNDFYRYYKIPKVFNIIYYCFEF